MTGILGGLPPGLRGYVAAQQQGDQRQMQEMQLIQGLLGVQAAARENEMFPLKQALLQGQVSEQQRLNGILGRFDPSSSQQASPEAVQTALTQGAAQGDVGPTVTNAARLPQPTQAGGNPFGLPANVNLALMHPKLQKWGEVQAGFFKPTDKMREAIALGFAPGSPQFNAHVGTQFNQGGAWQVSPQGGVNLAPGYAEGMGQVKRAEAGANAAFDFVDVPMPNGGTQKMSREDAARVLGQQITVGTQAPPPAAPSGPSAPSMFIPPAVQLQRDRERLGILQREGQAYPNDPSLRTEIGGVQARLNTAQPFGIPRTAVVPPRIGFQADETTRAADRETATLRAKGGVEREEKFRQTWGEANDAHGKLTMLEAFASDPNVASGALADNISGLKSIGESLGIRTAGLPAEEAFKAISTEMALRMKNQGGTNMMPGAMSDFENKLLQSMGPRLAQSKEGRMLLIQVFKAKAERDMKISEMAAEYVDIHGKLDNGFDRQVRAFAKSNPMFDPNRAAAMAELAKRLSGAR